MSGHGGNIGRLAAKLGCQPEEILDFSANINPLGPPEYVWNVLARTLPEIIHYPDPLASGLGREIAVVTGLAPDQIVPGNGTSELLFATLRTLDCQRALLPVPSYIDYYRSCEQVGIAVQTVHLQAKDHYQPNLDLLDQCCKPGDVVILGQPNNPTGRLIPRNELLALCKKHPQTTFLVDEAFAGFVEDYASVGCALPNIIVLCSLTKLFAVPGLRLGFLAASAEFCQKIRQGLAPWSMNTLALAAGRAMIGDTVYIRQSCAEVKKNRQWLFRALSNLGMLSVTPSTVNFLLVTVKDNAIITATELADMLLTRFKIAVRLCYNYAGLTDNAFRVAVRTPQDNERLVAALEKLLQPGKEAGHSKNNQKRQKRGKNKALMLLGTGSDVGKSVLVAGLCRVLLQDGVRVAPFKAQNMSLNSYVTRDGGEMGRAQVVQAQACRLDPDVRMNPILLKPCSDVGSQVIVHGRPVGNMRVKEYVEYKKQAWKEVCVSYDALSADFDCIVLEGAGSPGEVNLKSHDIVNMQMAKYAQSPALLVGDIDRGGVYASFVGHVEVMAPWERDLLAGFVVNRFRGDASLLDDAHAFLFERTGKPVLGVIPFINNLDLPQEDSVSFKAGLYDSTRPECDHVEIAVVDLPHISNFTDFEPLLAEPDVHLRIIRKVSELGKPDCLILPGSKNVVADLNYLEQSGFAKALVTLAIKGCEIVGICGGFQLLGQKIADPHGLEGEAGSTVRGLGLLDIKTTLAAEKTLIRKEGSHLPSNTRVHGYEIHHGISLGEHVPLLQFDDGSSCGLTGDSGKIWGCYLHGIFDADQFRRSFINSLRHNRGLPMLSGEGACYDLEPALDRLADQVRSSLDMDTIYQLLNL